MYGSGVCQGGPYTAEHMDVRDQSARGRLGQPKAARRANAMDGVSQRCLARIRPAPRANTETILLGTKWDSGAAA
jgi:hypothetical protein